MGKRQHKKAYDENREAEGLKEKAEVLRESAYQHDQHAEVEENRAERLRGRADQLKKEATVHREMHLMKNLNQMRNLVTSIDSDTNDFARVKINQMTPISDRVREKADWHGEGKNKFSGKTNETRSSREHNETNPMRNLVITYNSDDKSSDSKESDSDSESESSSNEKETSESAETSKESKSKESKSSQESKSEKSIVSLQESSVPRGEENGPRYNPNEILRFDSNGSEKGTNPQKR